MAFIGVVTLWDFLHGLKSYSVEPSCLGQLTLPQKSSAQKCSFELLHFRISSKYSKVRDTSQNA